MKHIGDYALNLDKLIFVIDIIIFVSYEINIWRRKEWQFYIIQFLFWTLLIILSIFKDYRVLKISVKIEVSKIESKIE